MSFRHIRNVRGFFSEYYLGSVFGRGRRRTLSDRTTDLAYARFTRIRDRAFGKAFDTPTFRERFARPFFRDVLGYHLGAGEENIHGLFASAEAEAAGGQPLLLAYCGGWDSDLDGGRGTEQPMRHVAERIAHDGLRYGIFLTGSCARLARAPGEGPRGGYLEIDFEGLSDDDDPESFAVAYRLLAAVNFQPGNDGKVPIEEVERESRLHAEKVSDDLKQAVFSAAESLAGGLLADAEARGLIADAKSLPATQLQRYRDAALTALYRILFILYAEARDARLEGHRLYREAYSAQGLLDEILGPSAREWPGNRCSLWLRIRALFRIYDRGLPPVSPWEHIPPRGGDFFSTTTPEGALLDAARLPDRDVARLMVALATTAPRRGVGRERVSFRELDIENLGSVYEGILEFEPRVATETILEVRAQGRPYALVPSDLVRLCAQKDLSLKGDLSIVLGTEAEALHPEGSTEPEAEEAEGEEDADETEQDEIEADEAGEDTGIRKGAAAVLVRRLEPGTFYFVPGPGRKGTGSFYTPRPLVRDIVHHAIGRLVEGRSAAEIEGLRVLDPACGSAHFLVEAMRYLGQALHRALVSENPGGSPAGFRSTTGQGWDEDWRASDEEARLANSEARAWCKRRVAERCLFGVDLNPTAVQLARVALWVESVAGDRPLTYFEHHVRCGNSLQGTWMDRLESPPIASRGGRDSPGHPGLFQATVRECIREAAALRQAITATMAVDLQREGIEPESISELEYKEHLHRRAGEALAAARLLFDLRSASVFVPEIWSESETLCSLVGAHIRLEAHAKERPWWDAFVAVRDRERFFHWELEFPEVFLAGEKSGFDAVLGNPPWDKVLPARTDFYARHDILIRAFTGGDLDRRIRELEAANPGLDAQFADYRSRTRLFANFLRHSGDFPRSEARTGAAHEDVSKYFLDRAVRLIRAGGSVGIVAPSVVYNGDGCVGLRRFLVRDACIDRFYGFENHEKIFPIDSRYKFVSLVFRKEAPDEDGFDAAFMRHDLGELDATASHPVSGRKGSPVEKGPWIVKLSRREIESLSPKTFAFLEYRGPEDQRIVRRMYEGRDRLGSGEAASWRAHLVSWRAHENIYNATEDKDLWTDPKGGRLFAPGWVLPKVPARLEETIELMRDRGFWPVYEGKHIEHFIAGIKPFRWWLSVELAEKKYRKLPRQEPTLVFRETASNTNERTCIAAVLPACSAASHKLTGMIIERFSPDLAATVLNSFVFDYALRMRTAGTSVSFTYMLPMPVPSVEAIRRIPAIPTRLAWQAGIDHISEDESAWPMLWQANRGVAEAYGLGPDDFTHVFSSFPGFARKRVALHVYFQQQIETWKAAGR